MSQEIHVDGQILTFSDEWKLARYDDWSAYRKIMAPLGRKGCDLVALWGDRLHLIEVKDYTYLGAAPPADLPQEVCRKAVDTLGLLCALSRHGQSNAETAFSKDAVSARSLTVCLNVELPDGGQGALAVAPTLMAYKDKIQSLTRRISDGRPIVANHHLPDAAPWQARRDPGTRAQHRDR